LAGTKTLTYYATALTMTEKLLLNRSPGNERVKKEKYFLMLKNGFGL